MVSQIDAFKSPQQLIHIQNNSLYTSTLEIAHAFGKLHKDVLRKVNNLECSEEFNQRNFTPVEYLDGKGEKRRSFNLTKNGFVFLVMGFGGKKAARIKESYVQTFDLMYEQLFKPVKYISVMAAFAPDRSEDYTVAIEALRELRLSTQDDSKIDRLEYVRATLIGYHTTVQTLIPQIDTAQRLLHNRHFRR